MRKRITAEMRFGENQIKLIVIIMLRHIMFNYVFLLYRMAIEKEFPDLKHIVDTEEIDDEVLELLDSVDDEVFEITLNLVETMKTEFDSFCNVHLVYFDDETEVDEIEDAEQIEVSDELNNKVRKIFNFLVYSKKAKNYRLYLNVLKYYTLSVFHILLWLSRYIHTGILDVKAIREKFGRNARFWNIPHGDLCWMSTLKGYDLQFLSKLAFSLERYYLELDYLIRRKNL